MFRRCYSWEEIYFYQSYLEYRVTHEPLGGNRFLNEVRSVAVQISALSHGHEVDDSIIANMIHTLLPAESWASRSTKERLRDDFRRPLNWDSVETEKQLFGAALCTNTLSYVRQSTALRDAMLSNPKSPDNSCVFGDYVELAAKFGNEELLEYLMTKGTFDLGPGLRFQLFESAAKGCRIDIVRFLYNFRSEDWSWHFESSTAWGKGPLHYIRASVRDPQVWDFIEALRIAHGMYPTGRKHLYDRIRHCAALGWMDMVSHLIRVAAHTDEGRNQYSVCMSSLSNYELSCKWRNEAVKHAIERGFVPIVELLLDDGADLNQTLASAARCGRKEALEMLLDRGANIGDALAHVEGTESRIVPAKLLAKAKYGHGPYLDVVRLLLDAGVDVNESIGKDSPLAAAIATEHAALFEFLLERGADLYSSGTAEECVRRARKDGLESMLLLLEKHGVDVNVD
ncbi:hypothetical protein J4E91_008006 [Alternaria rosae]|nr:hypothetical protein J4E91_008006 [Alternaria rosae]